VGGACRVQDGLSGTGEAEDVDALAEVNKRLNLQRGADSYEQAFRRIHRAGIAVVGRSSLAWRTIPRKSCSVVPSTRCGAAWT
jgi:hypothetical protein